MLWYWLYLFKECPLIFFLDLEILITVVLRHSWIMQGVRQWLINKTVCILDKSDIGTDWSPKNNIMSKNCVGNIKVNNWLTMMIHWLSLKSYIKISKSHLSYDCRELENETLVYDPLEDVDIWHLPKYL